MSFLSARMVFRGRSTCAGGALDIVLSFAPVGATPNLSPLAFLPGDQTLAPASGFQEQPAIAAGRRCGTQRLPGDLLRAPGRRRRILRHQGHASLILVVVGLGRKTSRNEGADP